MSWRCVEDKVVASTRKLHRCTICGDSIPIGSRVHTRKGLNEDGFCRMYMHEECEEYSTANFNYDDWDCYSEGDISRKEVIEWMRERYCNG